MGFPSGCWRIPIGADARELAFVNGDTGAAEKHKNERSTTLY
jgi:hypothetical protein